MLMATFATGALLAACGGTAIPTGAEGEPAGDVANQGGVDGVVAADVNGNGKGGGEDGPGDEGPVALPDAWAGTISAETLPATDGTQYLVMQYLFGDLQDATGMAGEEIEGMEFFGGQQVECDGVASLAGSSASCLLVDDSGGAGEIPVEVAMVPAAFGSPALLISADANGLTDLAIPRETALGLWSVGSTPVQDVTAGQIGEAAVNAVMMADSPDGELPPELAADCVVLDGGMHASCEVTGTPGAGGDGTWYATAQPGYAGTTYLFSKLPA